MENKLQILGINIIFSAIDDSVYYDIRYKTDPDAMYEKHFTKRIGIINSPENFNIIGKTFTIIEGWIKDKENIK